MSWPRPISASIMAARPERAIELGRDSYAERLASRISNFSRS